MTTTSHPDTRIQQHIPLALEVIDAVRRQDRADVQCALDRADLPALAIVLAAMVPDDRSLTDLLGWTATAEPRPRRKQPAPLRPCGTHAAYVRHKNRGETVDLLCRQAEKDYQNARPRDRSVA